MLVLRGPHLASRIAVKVFFLIPQGKLLRILGFDLCVGHFFTDPLREQTMFTHASFQRYNNRKKGKSKWLRSESPLWHENFPYDTATPPAFVSRAPGWFEDELISKPVFARDENKHSVPQPQPCSFFCLKELEQEPLSSQDGMTNAWDVHCCFLSLDVFTARSLSSKALSSLYQTILNLMMMAGYMDVAISEQEVVNCVVTTLL